MHTKEILDKIFKDPKTKYELSVFEDLGKPIHEIIKIYPKAIESGRDAGKTKYFMKSFVPFISGKTEVQVYDESGKSAPEEIVRQLWVYKLIRQYGYREDEIDLEKSIQFGTEVGTKAADIVVYLDNTKTTPKIVLEIKKPKRKDGIDQLKSYLNAEGSPIGVWSNGADSIILYRPYPKQFDDTLFDIPKRGEEPSAVLEKKRTLLDLKRDFNFKKIIQDLEELVLADSGADEFNEIFKLIFAKIWDEKEAQENPKRKKTVEFGKALDPEITYDRINKLFHSACKEWPGIFDEGDDIKLRKDHLQVCVGPIEGVCLMGSNLRIMDDAFEYLLPTEAKKKKGQFFTPRHVVEMCVRMLNPKPNEYVMDPACGSAGFLLHAMDWCYPAKDAGARELRKHRYAAKYLWGIDLETRAAKTSRALMLIAGDGHTNIFGPDVSSLDPRTWYNTGSGLRLMQSLRDAKLTKKKIPDNETLKDEDLAWEYFDELQFDVILANPPFAGEMKDKKMLAHYALAKPALKRANDKGAKEERDVLFIERILKWLKPSGRAAIVLPQGKFNNSSLAFIREWILRKARLLAVVGLHPNTFKPHTGTKTSVLFVQKYTEQELKEIENKKEEVAKDCPDYEQMIRYLLLKHKDDITISEEEIPEAIAELLLETFHEPESDNGNGGAEEGDEDEAAEPLDLEDRMAQSDEEITRLRNELLQSRQQLEDLTSDVEALEQQRDREIEVLEQGWTSTKRELTQARKKLRVEYKEKIKAIKVRQKEEQNTLNVQIKGLEKAIAEAEESRKRLTIKGQMELILSDPDLLGKLKDRWIDAEVAKRLDYSIFMAVSERGGKDNSGEYVFVTDEDGNYIENLDNHRHPGRIVDQDLVNYNLGAEDLEDASKIPDDQLCIAEAFVRFAQEHRFDFWKGE